MLFYIPTSIIEELKISPSKSLIDALDNLAFVRLQGLHLLLSSPKNLEYLKNFTRFQPKTKSLFAYLHSNFPTLNGVISKLTYFVTITTLPRKMEISQLDKKSTLLLSIEYLQDIRVLAINEILAENITEIKFYEKISYLFKKQNRLNYLKGEFIKLQGGGDTTASIYGQRQAEMKSFCLCFVDSDKYYPNGKEGDTLKKVREIDEPNQLLCKYFPLSVREIENLIPIKCLEKICHISVNWKKGLEFIKRLQSLGYFEEIKYIDYKHGLPCKKIKDAKTNPELFSYIKKILIDTNSCTQIQIDEILKMCDEDLKLSEPVVNGVGAKILDKAIEINFDEERIGFEDLFDFQKEEWNRIGQEMLNWTCSTSRLVI